MSITSSFQKSQFLNLHAKAQPNNTLTRTSLLRDWYKVQTRLTAPRRGARSSAHATSSNPMRLLVSSNLTFMLKRKPDLIEPIEQAVLAKLINLKGNRRAVGLGDRLRG